MLTDKQKIESVIQVYFNCMYESSSEKAHAAFHPDAWISGYLPNGYQHMTVPEFGDFVAAQQPSPKSKGDVARLEIISLEVAGQTAVARVRDAYLGLVFLDTLSFIKLEGQWLILNKLFHVED
jgi:hypothetical protein